MWSEVIRPQTAISLLVGLLCAQMPAQIPQSTMARYSGSYANHEYGYEIPIPEGLTAVGATPPNPNHGVRISIPGSMSYIWVDASYTDSSSLTQVEEDVLSGTDELCGTSRKIKRQEAKLSTLRSVHLLLECTDGNAASIEVVAAIRSAYGRSNILYEIGVVEGRASPKDKECKRLMDAILRQFKLLSLNPNPSGSHGGN